MRSPHARPHIDRQWQKLLSVLLNNDRQLDGDSARLKQVFGNLINNGSKHNDIGGEITETSRIRARSQKAGCNHHLIKPVEANELDKLLAELKSAPRFIKKEPRSMAKRHPQHEEDKIDRLVHDICGCLHAIGLGVAVLKEMPNDNNCYTEVCDSIVREHESAIAQLQELREYVRQNR